MESYGEYQPPPPSPPPKLSLRSGTFVFKNNIYFETTTDQFNPLFHMFIDGVTRKHIGTTHVST